MSAIVTDEKYNDDIGLSSSLAPAQSMSNLTDISNNHESDGETQNIDIQIPPQDASPIATTTMDIVADNSLSTIKRIMIETEDHLKRISKLKSNMVDKLIDELGLTFLKKLKHAIKNLSSNELTNGNTTADKTQSTPPSHLAIATADDEKENKMQNEFMSGNAHLSDSISVTSAATGFTGISSIAPPMRTDDPLIAIVGIGKYNGLPNLDGIEKDYDNVINTFVNHWKFKVIYKLSDNTCVYTNNENELRRNYKLKWNIDEIEEFVEQTRKYIVKNKHNGLLFAISSHGDTGKILYDSECEEYELDCIFSMFSPEAHQLVNSYKETEEETNHLFNIPKIFCLDMCRGNSKAKVTKVPTASHTDDTKSNDESDHDTGTAKNPLSLHETTPLQQSQQSHTNQTTKKNESKTATPSKTNVTSADEETFTMKGVTKAEAQTLVAQMANFCKLYANVDGYSVADGSKDGGIFLRNVCKCFSDTDFVLKHNFSDIILKIREYTKRDATLNGTLFNFTQLVENEGTLERQVVFGSKYLNLIPSFDITNEPINEEEIESKITITNASQYKIAVLVEMEEIRENRENVLEMLKQLQDAKFQNFIEHKFIVIDQGNSHSFEKTWESVCVTLFELSNDQQHENKEIYDRRLFFSENLYYKNDKLHEINDLIPPCAVVSKQTHPLKPILIDEDNNEDDDSTQCVLCDGKMHLGDYAYVCSNCRHSLCKKCCHLIITQKTPVRLEIPPTDIKFIRQSDTTKLSLTCQFSKNLIERLKRSNLNNIKCEFKSITRTSKQLLQAESVCDLKSLDDNQTFEVELPSIWEKEIKEDEPNLKIKMRLVDMDNNIHSYYSKSRHHKIKIHNFFKYSCTFTTLNGKGRFGPTYMADYLREVHFNDTVLDDEQKGMQLWKVPKTGKWKIICHGAKGRFLQNLLTLKMNSYCIRYTYVLLNLVYASFYFITKYICDFSCFFFFSVLSIKVHKQMKIAFFKTLIRSRYQLVLNQNTNI